MFPTCSRCDSTEGCRPSCNKSPAPHVLTTSEDGEESDQESRHVDWDSYFLPDTRDPKTRRVSRTSSSEVDASCCLSDLQSASADALLGACCPPTARRLVSGRRRLSISTSTRHPTYDEHLATAEEHAKSNGQKTTPFGRWLADRNLERFEGPLAKLGVYRVADLVYLTDEDMDTLNVDPKSRMQFYVRVTEHHTN